MDITDIFTLSVQHRVQQVNYKHMITFYFL